MENKLLKYKSFAEWSNAEPSAYESARVKGLFGKIAEITGWALPKKQNRKPHGYWTKEKAIENAKLYTRRIDWEKTKGSSYGVAKYNGWYDECVAHMDETLKPSGYWTLERCIEDAKQYEYKEDWKTAYLIGKSTGAYNAARKNKEWFLLCTAHMKQKIKPSGYWTKERCIEEAKKYTKPNDWIKGNQTSHNRSKKMGWFEEATKHMIKKHGKKTEI